MKNLTGRTEIKQYLTGRKRETGVVITADLDIVVVYSSGYRTNYVTVRDYYGYEYDGKNYHTKSTCKNIERAIRWLKNHNPEFTREETEHFRTHRW